MRRALFAVCLAGGVSCGRPLAPAPRAAHVSTDRPVRESERPGTPTEPRGALGFARLNQPAQSWPRFAGLIPADASVRAILQQRPDELIELALGPRLAAAVDLNASLDMLVVAGAKDEPKILVSVAIADYADAVAKLRSDYQLTTRTAYRSSIEPRQPSGLVFNSNVCELWRDRAGARGRMICGPDAQLVADAADYLSWRGERSTAHDSQLSVEIGQRLMHSADLGAEHHEPGISPAERQGEEFGRKLIASVSQLELGATLGDSRAKLSGRFEYSHTDIPLLRLLLAHRERGRAPQVFSRLPRDAALALYTNGIARGALSDVRDRMLADFVEMINASDRDWNPAGDAELIATLRGLAFTGGPLILASGLDVDGAVGATRDFLGGDRTDRSRVAKLRHALEPWFLVGVAEPMDTWATGIARLFEIDRKYSNVKVTSQSAKNARPGLGGTRVVKASPSVEAVDFINEAAPVKIEGADGAAVHWIDDRVPNPSYTAPAPDWIPYTEYTVHVFLARVADYTWICSSDDPGQCPRMLTVLSRGGAATYEATPVARAIAKSNDNFVAVTSSAAATLLFADNHTSEQLVELDRNERAIAGFAGRGREPILVSGGTDSNDDATAGSLRLDVRVRADELASWVAAVAH